MSSNPDIQVFGPADDPFALVVPSNTFFSQSTFVTNPKSSLQLGFLHFGSGQISRAHIHKEIARTIKRTAECLIVQEGRAKLALFGETQKVIYEIEICEGDTVLLLRGGHKITALLPCRIIEVKQGPFLLKDDKLYLEDENL